MSRKTYFRPAEEKADSGDAEQRRMWERLEVDAEADAEAGVDFWIWSMKFIHIIHVEVMQSGIHE